MKWTILHESAGRLRVHLHIRRLSPDQADWMEETILQYPGVRKATVYERTADAVILYSGTRAELLEALSRFSFSRKPEGYVSDPGRMLRREFEEKLLYSTAERAARRILLPAPLRAAVTVCRALPYFQKGLACLWNRKLAVPVLDATAIGVAVARGDYETASSVMFMLHLGELLEDWTHRKSVSDLARTMALNVNQVWQKTPEGEVLVQVSSVQEGDLIVVRTGSTIPLDGKVTEGAASVNQASMTGESLPVRKEAGAYAYSGTVVEEGEITIQVEKTLGSGRYDRVVKMIEESEKLKSASEMRAASLADRLVPWSLGTTALAYLLTGNPTRAISALMVDFSCALKLAMPLSVLSAMREAGDHRILVKGGKYLEAVAEADVFVFDKTGTLTKQEPRVAEVITFGRRKPDEMLRLAACLEEHYPHSIANAVVNAAMEQGLNHEERHAEVQYVVAHGIASSIDGEKVVIGSRHFLFEDEGVTCSERDMKKLAVLPDQYSHLYLAIGGKLAAVICIEDRLRDDARQVLKNLRSLGVSQCVMMTGDNRRTASSVAAMVGVDDFHAEVLPEDKAGFVREQRQKGLKVIMVGDGVNDSPALSEADAGIAISEGAAIAREIADITISEDRLDSLVTLKQISNGLSRRIDMNYRAIISFNFSLILLGVFGVLTPASTALLHNVSTLAIGLHSMTNVVPEKAETWTH